MKKKSVFQQMYDKEENFVIDCFWDNGFGVRFGDCTNGYTDEYDCETWRDVVEVFEKKLTKLSTNRGG